MVDPKYVATNRSVDRDELLDFVRPRHHGVLLTCRRDGWPQSSLVTMGLGDEGEDEVVWLVGGEDADVDVFIDALLKARDMF